MGAVGRFTGVVAGGVAVVGLVIGTLGGIKSCAFDEGGTASERFGKGFAGATIGTFKGVAGGVLDIAEDADPAEISDATRRARDATGEIGSAVLRGLFETEAGERSCYIDPDLLDELLASPDDKSLMKRATICEGDPGFDPNVSGEWITGPEYEPR